MAHMIDNTTGRDAIAYTGATPWHGLGQALTPGASIETWTEQAGLGYTVLESPVLYSSPACDPDNPVGDPWEVLTYAQDALGTQLLGIVLAQGTAQDRLDGILLADTGHPGQAR